MCDSRWNLGVAQWPLRARNQRARLGNLCNSWAYIYICVCVSVYAFYRKIGEWDGLFGGIEASAWK